MLIVMIALCGGSSLILAGGAALCALSPTVKRELIGEAKAR